jgi:fluoride exporter
MSVFKLLLIGLGGALGSITRHALAKTVQDALHSMFPFGTLLINIVGSFFLGVVYMLAVRNAALSENWRLFLGVGFCGGFTTFSAFALENFTLLDQKLVGTSVLYIAVSVVAGILALGVGVWVSRFF